MLQTNAVTAPNSTNRSTQSAIAGRCIMHMYLGAEIIYVHQHNIGESPNFL